jgi:hypothetical protein
MGQKLTGLTWLDSRNHEQLKWAHKYLQGKGVINQQQPYLTSDQLIQIGEGLENSRNGVLTLGRMRDAWRQVKCNASDKDKKRKTSAFKLRIDVKNELTRLAKMNQITAADMLGRLILGGPNNDAARHGELKAQLRDSRGEIKKQKDTSAILADLLKNSIKTLCQFEIQLQDARFSAESSPKDQSRKVKKLYKQRMNDITDVITVRTRLSPEELFERIIQKNDSAYRAAEEGEDSTPTQPTQAQMTIDENPVADPAPQDQQTPEAKLEPSNALMSNSTNPVIYHPVSEDLEAQANESASAHLTTGGPSPSTHAATQSPLGGGISFKALGISFANKKKPITSTVKTEPD